MTADPGNRPGRPCMFNADSWLDFVTCFHGLKTYRDLHPLAEDLDKPWNYVSEFRNVDVIFDYSGVNEEHPGEAQKVI